ncbi:MAG: outer membrane lipoprotein carrier protein LolA [Alphaproteobacteria bacterium]|nr:outer membrane lipoprotein carrier protein LolA [Alphaproteobacteria bacterium]
MKKIIVAFLMCVFARGAFAAVDTALIERAEKYLNSLTGLTGDFVQTNKGKQEQGTFSMLRPGRVRLDYKNLPVQLMADGADLYFYDKSLDQITTVPLTSTPAGILVRKKIDLQKADINVVDTAKGKTTFALKMNLRGREGLGTMVMVFNRKDNSLNSWTIIDAVGNKTDVVFNNLKTKTDFAKNYFQIQRHKTVSTGGGDDFYD